MRSLTKWAFLLCLGGLLVACTVSGFKPDAAPEPAAGRPSTHALIFASDAAPNLSISTSGTASSAPSQSGASSSPNSRPNSTSSSKAGAASNPVGVAQTQNTGSGGWPWGYATSPGSTPNNLFVDKYGFFYVGNYDAATYKPYPMPSFRLNKNGHVCVWVPRSWHSEPQMLGPGAHVYECASGLDCPVGGCLVVQLELPACVHNFSRVKILVEPTQTTSGQKRTECAKCGSYGAVELIAPLGHVAGDPIPPLPVCPHEYGEWKVDFYWGDKTYWERVCKLCQHSESKSVVNEKPAVCEHVFGEWVVTRPATEKVQGLKTRFCTLCNKEEGKGIPLLPHQHVGEWVITFEPSHAVPGERKRVCTACRELEVEALPMLVCTAHSFVETTVPPTETEPGYTEQHCQICQQVGERQELPPLGPPATP